MLVVTSAIVLSSLMPSAAYAGSCPSVDPDPDLVSRLALKDSVWAPLFRSNLVGHVHTESSTGAAERLTLLNRPLPKPLTIKAQLPAVENAAVSVQWGPPRGDPACVVATLEDGDGSPVIKVVDPGIVVTVTGTVHGKKMNRRFTPARVRFSQTGLQFEVGGQRCLESPVVDPVHNDCLAVATSPDVLRELTATSGRFFFSALALGVPPSDVVADPAWAAIVDEVFEDGVYLPPPGKPRVAVARALIAHEATYAREVRVTAERFLGFPSRARAIGTSTLVTRGARVAELWIGGKRVWSFGGPDTIKVQVPEERMALVWSVGHGTGHSNLEYWTALLPSVTYSVDRDGRLAATESDTPFADCWLFQGRVRGPPNSSRNPSLTGGDATLLQSLQGAASEASLPGDLFPRGVLHNHSGEFLLELTKAGEVRYRFVPGAAQCPRAGAKH